jgi:hypothetical protein
MSLPRRRGPRLSDVQALYFIGTGIWPIMHLRSFEAVTGPKRDDWLVKTFGALVAAIGVAMVSSRDEATSAERIGLASAAALICAEVVFAGRGRIRPIYLADAALEAGFAAAAARTISRRGR